MIFFLKFYYGTNHLSCLRTKTIASRNFDIPDQELLQQPTQRIETAEASVDDRGTPTPKGESLTTSQEKEISSPDNRPVVGKCDMSTQTTINGVIDVSTQTQNTEKRQRNLWADKLWASLLNVDLPNKN